MRKNTTPNLPAKPRTRTVLSSHAQDQGLFMLAAVMGGVPIDEVSDAIDRRAHARLAMDQRLPIEGSPGFVRGPGEHPYRVKMEGIEERMITMMRWIQSGGLGDDVGRAEYQIKRLADAIDNAKAWDATGVRFGEPIDELFREATFPVGWRMQRTDHAMWSNLLDHHGRQRVSIFHKAAFYDRKASMHLCRRFHAGMIYGDERVVQSQVKDGERTIFVTPPERVPKTIDRHSGAYFQWREPIEKLQLAVCYAWLDERYPQHADISAHWDEDPQLALERCPTVVP